MMMMTNYYSASIVLGALLHVGNEDEEGGDGGIRCSEAGEEEEVVV